MNMLIPICQNFFSSLKKYGDVEQLRNLIYGVSCLIKTDVEALPDVIKAGMQKIVESLIKLAHKYTKEREREKIDELEEQTASETIGPEALEFK
mmetsp:Transcript_8248/g.9350  ORF Transcript_8248/g.9350 Transcript_8248/m.9350 type:complete len:94 (+) Transcript_8248:804-1085(+)